MGIKRSSCSQTQTHGYMRLKPTNRTKTSGTTEIKGSPYFDKTNKKVIGKFKDEAQGTPIIEFVGLRPKMYSYKKDDDKGGKTAKGIKKSVINKETKHEHYKQVLLCSRQLRHAMRTIRSDHHRLGSCKLKKVSLSCFDYKRYILKDVTVTGIIK